MASLIDTNTVSAQYRARAVDLHHKRLLITNFRGTTQEPDLSEPPNCDGFGRIRHFRRTTSAGWPANALPIDPACKSLRLPLTDTLRAQVFQNAVCNWRCWYCFVPFNADGDFQDPSLRSLIPGDILPSVSRREPRRRCADVWTSGNRIFACQGRHILQQIVHAVAVDQLPCEVVAAALHRPLRMQEVKLIACTVQKIQRIARLEHRETARFAEGKTYARVARTSRA